MVPVIFSFRRSWTGSKALYAILTQYMPYTDRPRATTPDLLRVAWQEYQSSRLNQDEQQLGDTRLVVRNPRRGRICV